MPWFFYKSGSFFSCSDVFWLAHKGRSKLLKPFLIWSIIGYIVYCVVQLIWRTTSLGEALLIVPLKRLIFENLIVCNDSLWFLLTMFCVINIGNILFNKIHPLLISFLGIAIGYFINLSLNENIPDLVANTATGLCFFCMGYWMQGKERNMWIILASIVGYILAIFLYHSPFVDIRINQCLVDRSGYDYLIWFPACFCGIIVLNYVCYWSMKIYSFPILRFIGMNAMAFYVLHKIPLYITVNMLKYNFHIPEDSMIGITCRTIVLLLTILLMSGCLLIRNRLREQEIKNTPNLS